MQMRLRAQLRPGGQIGYRAQSIKDAKVPGHLAFRVTIDAVPDDERLEGAAVETLGDVVRGREVSRNSITTECADFQTVGELVLKPTSARASAGCGGETPSMNVMNLMVVALAGWINQQQEDVIDNLREDVRILKEILGKTRLAIHR
jgi:hypothetical protein